MPELPDIGAYLSALRPRIVGQRIMKIRVTSAFVLRTAQPPITDAEGRVVCDLRRLGKRVAVATDNDLWIVIHLMIAGRLHWRAPNAKLAGRNTLAAFDFAGGSLVLTETGTKRRASIHVIAGEAALYAMDPGGIDVMSSSFQEFRERMLAENRTLKRALTDPRILSGIGNAYSDEILHAARLSPILQTHKMTVEEWHRLYGATQTTLEVTAFRAEMAVHGRFGKPCPRCAAPVQRIRYAGNETNYCARCQTGGKLLADRALSRLLGKDWPRTLDELESLTRRHD